MGTFDIHNIYIYIDTNTYVYTYICMYIHNHTYTYTYIYIIFEKFASNHYLTVGVFFCFRGVDGVCTGSIPLAVPKIGRVLQCSLKVRVDRCSFHHYSHEIWDYSIDMSNSIDGTDRYEQQYRSRSYEVGRPVD